jgi:hypothetical protein
LFFITQLTNNNIYIQSGIKPIQGHPRISKGKMTGAPGTPLLLQKMTASTQNLKFRETLKSTVKKFADAID